MKGKGHMSRLNDPENFVGRVAYAAKIIAYGGSPSRAFDNCFENHDGDEVATAIVRRARRNPKIAANLHRYLNLASAEEATQRLAAVPTRKLPAVARETRTRKAAEFKAWLEDQDRSKPNADVRDPAAEGRGS
jgi:hypothetical protein